ncbi:hypothetical protein CC78DRAFT_534220 [Lojkania enalia]|uniref:Uncharacterized protein n=1 Tax=Lojkania enalia TaxID=147567 RepID=A0A9P4MZ27_9PLEO|nr:hypothetical protein CC78DRAFT_534220 [Didymosphaeria enalia]
MRPAFKHRTARSPSPISIVRPWTPPDLDPPMGQDPYAPTKTPGTAPIYPYTPDSARTNRTYELPPLSPLPPMPWDRSNKDLVSPMQNALFSCLTNLEHLIHTSEPSDKQMEYIISQFENISSYLSAPEAQSRQSDDHLFEFEQAQQHGFNLGDSGIADVGIRGVTVNGAKLDDVDDEETEDVRRYIVEVDKYINGVRGYSSDLKNRLDEVKQLNDIQLEIIRDLRKEVKERKEKLNSKPKPKIIVVERKEREIRPQRWGFFVALGEALDQFGEMLFNEC